MTISQGRLEPQVGAELSRAEGRFPPLPQTPPRTKSPANLVASSAQQEGGEGGRSAWPSSREGLAWWLQDPLLRCLSTARRQETVRPVVRIFGLASARPGFRSQSGDLQAVWNLTQFPQLQYGVGDRHLSWGICLPCTFPPHPPADSPLPAPLPRRLTPPRLEVRGCQEEREVRRLPHALSLAIGLGVAASPPLSGSP